MDPLAGSSWSAPGTVAGFVASPPNETLIQFAQRRLVRAGLTALDIGCGAARNAVPLAELGWNVIGVDLSKPMLEGARERRQDSPACDRLAFLLAPMDALPVASRSVDLVVAHGIWNLARSGAEFRGGVREAARVARPGASLFVFTFSRRTLANTAQPIAGETFVFTDFSGEPQVFLTAEQLASELAAAGFTPDPAVPLTEHNVPRPGTLSARRMPVIYEAAYRFNG